MVVRFLVLIAILVAIILIPGSAQAATYTCGSGANSCTGGSACTVSNLNSCISGASDGDIINIASGTYNWDPDGGTYVNVNKRVTISGGGYCGTSIDDDPGADCGDIVNPGGSWPVGAFAVVRRSQEILRWRSRTGFARPVRRLTGLEQVVGAGGPAIDWRKW